MRFKEIVAEAAEGKNLHLEHIEDLVFLQGASGAQSALQYVNSVRDMLEEGGTANSSVTVKWDGAPAIFCGIDPADGKFFVAKKGIFNKDSKVYKTNADIDADISSEGLNNKMKIALANLSKLGITNVLQGDLMYTRDDLESKDIDGEDSWVFQPNTIAYAVPKGSDLGKRIAASQMGIIFHTTYVGDTMQDMTASFGADVSSLNKSSNIWVDDAAYKDLSGQASLTKQENQKI